MLAKTANGSRGRKSIAKKEERESRRERKNGNGEESVMARRC